MTETTSNSVSTFENGKNATINQNPQEGKKKSYTKNDFEFGNTLGEGAYSRVVLTTLKQNGKKYATKVIQKQLIVKMNKSKTVIMEKQVLNKMDHPNIIKLFCTYQDKENLYFVLELAPGGELFSYIQKYGPFSLEATVFYAAEIVNALEYMHGLGILHRDLKPENIILNKDMHAKITDFGTAKIKGANQNDNDNDEIMKRKHKQTFCGTAEYVSPEILKDEPCTEGSDLWALGCIIFQCLTGRHPFKAESEYLIFQKILKRELEFPADFPETSKDIVNKLLQLDPNKRLGLGPDGYKNLKSHPFFNGIDFENINNQVPPPIIPHKQPDLEEEEEGQVSSFQTIKNEAWKSYLLKGENIIFTSPIIKRRRLSSKRRQLIVTDRPRIMYIDVGNQEIKGTIPWSDELKLIKKSEKDFVISIPGRDYIMEDVHGKVDEWAKAFETVRTIKSNK